MVPPTYLELSFKQRRYKERGTSFWVKRQPLRPLQIIRSHNPRKIHFIFDLSRVQRLNRNTHYITSLVHLERHLVFLVQIPTVMPCQNIAISPYFPLLDTESDSQDGIFWAGLLSHGKSITFALIYLSNSSPYAFVTDIELLTWIPLTISVNSTPYRSPFRSTSHLSIIAKAVLN